MKASFFCTRESIGQRLMRSRFVWNARYVVGVPLCLLAALAWCVFIFFASIHRDLKDKPPIKTPWDL